MTPPLRSNLLPKLLAHPNKIRQALDRHKASSGSVLTLCVHWDRLDAAVASHPSTQLDPLSLPPVPVVTTKSVAGGNRRLLVSSNVAHEVQRIAVQFHVCGVVVHWPIQQPEGWCGAHCGRVWFILEQLLLTDNDALLQHGTPVCLWNSERTVQAPAEDSWGRSPTVGAASTSTSTSSSVPRSPFYKMVYRSSREQPQPLASEVWNDYCRAQWPTSVVHRPRHSAGTAKLSAPATRWSPKQANVVRDASPRWTAATAPPSPPEPPIEDLF